jgi:predicted deacylase
MPNYGPIEYDIDLESPGKRVDSLRLTYSDNTNAFSVIPIPIAVIANGSGPTVLLAAGNHGNEYEGQVILRELVRELSAHDVQGRLIVLPSMNMPAVRADVRVSPLDGGNLNRVFPGAADRGPTDAIAGFVANVLLPLCDAGIDIHTGGNMGTFVPLVFLCRCDDRAVFQKSAELAFAFAAPWTYLVTGIEDEGGFDPCSQTQGVAFISTELGGGWRLGHETLSIGRRGVRNMLAHLGVVKAAGDAGVPLVTPRYLTNSGSNSNLVSHAAGFLETYFEPGMCVNAGDVVATVHPIENGFDPPIILTAPRGGVIVSQRTTAHLRHGDIVMNIAGEIAQSDITAAVS